MNQTQAAVYPGSGGGEVRSFIVPNFEELHLWQVERFGHKRKQSNDQVRTNDHKTLFSPGSSTRIHSRMNQRIFCSNLTLILRQMLADKAVQQLIRDRLRATAAAALASDEFASAKVITNLVLPPLVPRAM